MKSLGPYLVKEEQEEIQEKVLALTIASMYSNYLTESEELNEGIVGSLLDKLGLKIHKSKGILSYIKDFTSGVGKLLLAALKGDKKKVKEISTSISKEEFLDFLLKLDEITLHLVTGPIYFIDAVTGWMIWPEIKNIAQKAGNVYDDIKKAIDDLKKKVASYIDSPKKEQLLLPLGDLESALGET